MNAFTSPRLVSEFKRFSQAASITIIAIGSAVLFGGWALGIPGLQSLVPGLPKMMSNTSLGLLLSGASLFLWNSFPRTLSSRWIASGFAWAVVVIGVLTITQYLLGADLGIDQWLFKDRSVGATYPGRPSPQTSLALTLTGLSLLLLGGKSTRAVWTGQALGLSVWFIALIALVGYVHGSSPFYSVTSYTGMAVHTVLSFLALSFGLVFAQPDRGLAAVFTSDSGSGALARRLLPAVIVFPLLLGGFRAWGERAGLYPTEFGLALHATLYIAGLAVLLWIFARTLERAEAGRREAAEALESYSVQLEAANEELRAFSYSVAHDLRAPLRSIDGFSQALAEDYGGKLDGDAIDYLGRVRNATRRMGELIDDLLRLSRVTAYEMHLGLVDLSDMARQIANELRSAEPARQAQFVVAEGITAKGDGHLLRIVLENLLNNAWKFTSKQDSARIEFGSLELDGSPIYFVRDDGAGFDMAYGQKLFKPFNRLHATDDFPGNGIGLTMAQRIVRRHSGNLWAEGAVEKGATFYFTLGK